MKAIIVSDTDLYRSVGDDIWRALLLKHNIVQTMEELNSTGEK